MDFRSGCSYWVSRLGLDSWIGPDCSRSALRHIRLLNTPEQKPITNSRDTQELHYEAGCEVLKIFLEYQTKSKTSLLQDFAYYEVRLKIPHESDADDVQSLAASRAIGDSQMPPPPPPSAPAHAAGFNLQRPMSAGQMLPPPVPGRFR